MSPAAEVVTSDARGWCHTRRMTRHLARYAIAAILLIAGIGHFRATASFIAQVPTFLPAARAIIRVSGVIELVLGVALLVVRRHRAQLGVIVALYFVIIFPGNVSQLVTHTSAFGLDTDTKRAVRLLLQPALIAVSLWSTGGWKWLRKRTRWL